MMPEDNLGLCGIECADKAFLGASSCILLPRCHVTSSGMGTYELPMDVLLPVINALFARRGAKTLQPCSCHILLSCVEMCSEQVTDLVLASQLKACDAQMSCLGAVNLASFSLATWRSSAARQRVQDAQQALDALTTCQGILSGALSTRQDTMTTFVELSVDLSGGSNSSRHAAKAPVNDPVSSIHIISLPGVEEADLCKALSHTQAKARQADGSPTPSAAPSGVSDHVWSVLCGLLDSSALVLVMEDAVQGGGGVPPAHRLHNSMKTKRTAELQSRQSTTSTLEGEVMHLRSLLAAHGIPVLPALSAPTDNHSGSPQAVTPAQPCPTASAHLRPTLSSGSSFFSVGSEGWAPGTPTALPTRCQAADSTSQLTENSNSGTSTLLPGPASGEVTCDISHPASATREGAKVKGGEGQVTAHLQAACEVLQARLSLGKLKGIGIDSVGDEKTGQCPEHHINLTTTTTTPLMRSSMNSMDGSCADVNSMPSNESYGTRVATPEPMETHFTLGDVLARAVSSTTGAVECVREPFSSGLFQGVSAHQYEQLHSLNGGDKVLVASYGLNRIQPTIRRLSRTASAPSHHTARPPRIPSPSSTAAHAPSVHDLSEQLRLTRAELIAAKAQLAVLAERVAHNGKDDHQALLEQLQEEVDMLRSECAIAAQDLSAAQAECAHLHVQLQRQTWIMRQMQDRLKAVESMTSTSSLPGSPRCSGNMNHRNPLTPTSTHSQIPHSPHRIALGRMHSLGSSYCTATSQPNSPRADAATGNSKLPISPFKSEMPARTRPGQWTTSAVPGDTIHELKSKVSSGSTSSNTSGQDLPRYMQPIAATTPRGSPTSCKTHPRPFVKPHNSPSAAFAPPSCPGSNGLCRQTSLGPRVPFTPTATKANHNGMSSGVAVVATSHSYKAIYGPHNVPAGSKMFKSATAPVSEGPYMKTIPNVIISGGLVRLVRPENNDTTTASVPPPATDSVNVTYSCTTGSTTTTHGLSSSSSGSIPPTPSPRSRVPSCGPPTSLPGRPSLESVRDVEDADVDECDEFDVELSMPPSIGGNGLNHQHMLRTARA